MEDDEDTPPFWLQNTGHGRRRRRQVSSFFLSSGVLLVLLLIIAFFLVFVIVPSFISFTSQIFRPHLVKKGWDSLNLVLVVFAIVCGFLNINTSNNNESPSPSYYREQNLSNDGKQAATRSPRWYDQFQQDRTPRLSRLRSFSSYPDLRQESSWITNDERWRFYDDTHINNYRLSSSDQINLGPPLQLDQEAKKPEVHQEHDEVLEGTETKDIAVDTVVSGQDKEVVYSPPSPPPMQPPPAPPSPPPLSRSPPRPPSSKVVKRKVKRTYQDVESESDHRRIKKELEVENFYIPPPSPPPPPPPPPPVFSKSEKRRGKDFLISLRRKRKKQRQKSVENLESFFNLETSLPSSIPPPSPPPPPPPPPPPHFFQNLFSSKKGKTKKTHSVPPPPPPPPPAAVTTRVEACASRTRSEATSVVTTHKPPKPLRTTSAGSVEDNVDSGSASPLRPIPPPPPPPPFKIPAWKFVLDGDYVRVGSFNSSRSGSPDLESVEDQSDKESSPVAGNNGGGEPVAMPMPLFCPSPDVNTKADNFIARFRAGLRMEKMNSVKGRSNLGPEASLLGPETE